MSINFKKYTKEQMGGMVEAEQAANAELERQVAALGDRISKQNDILSDYANKTANFKVEISTLRAKLRDTEASLGKANADLVHQIESNRTLTFELNRKDDRINALAEKLVDCKADLKRAKEHPWKHLWECLTGSRND